MKRELVEIEIKGKGVYLVLAMLKEESSMPVFSDETIHITMEEQKTKITFWAKGGEADDVVRFLKTFDGIDVINEKKGGS